MTIESRPLRLDPTLAPPAIVPGITPTIRKAKGVGGGVEGKPRPPQVAPPPLYPFYSGGGSAGGALRGMGPSPWVIITPIVWIGHL